MPERLVTFDVWDTLLRRRCDPETVKLFTCRALIRLRPAGLDQPMTDAWRLLALRHAVEAGLLRAGRARGGDGDYALSDVLHEVVRRAFRAQASEADVSSMASRLAAIELAQERFVSYPDPTIGKTIASLGNARLAFLSDFHVSRGELAELLCHNGYAQIAGTGLVSCDVGLSKRTGRLFEQARIALPVGNAHWLHVGDDPVADVAVPRRLGVDAQQHLPPGEHRLRQLKSALLGRPQAVIERSLHALMDAAADDRHAPASAGEVRRGAALSPLLAGYALWLVEIAIARRAEQIVFAGPGAELLSAAYARVAAVYADGLPAALPVVAPASHTWSGPITGDRLVAAFDAAALPSLPPDGSFTCFATTGGAQTDPRTSYLAVGDIARLARDPDTKRFDPAPLTAASEALTGALLAGVDRLAFDSRTHALAAADLEPWALASSLLLAGDASTSEAALPTGAALVATLAALARREMRHRRLVQREPCRSLHALWVPASIRLRRRLRAWLGHLRRQRSHRKTLGAGRTQRA